jgi:four helix bundle protein
VKVGAVSITNRAGAAMQPFTDLKVWQRSHALVLQIYALTREFPAEERFGLIAQLRRAATSVATNIAEGSRRQHAQDFARFLNVAEASLAEVEYLLMLTRDLGYADASAVQPHLVETDEIQRMLFALRRKVEGVS